MTLYVVNNIDPSPGAALEYLEELKLVTENDTVVDMNFPDTYDSHKHVDPEAIKGYYSSIEKEDGLLVILNGSGNFHHHTYGFCRGIIDQDEKEYTVFHYDQHGDSRDNSTVVDCGNYLGMLVRDSTFVEKSVILGASSMVHGGYWLDSDVLTNGVEIYPYSNAHARFKDVSEKVDVDCVSQGKSWFGNDLKIKWHTIAKNNIHSITQRAIDRTETDNVYITVDLDVLTKYYAQTDWGNGEMYLEEVLDSIQMVKEQKHIVGLDICGTDGTTLKFPTLYSVAAIVNEITDGPYSRDFFLDELYEDRNVIEKMVHWLSKKFRGI